MFDDITAVEKSFVAKEINGKKAKKKIILL